MLISTRPPSFANVVDVLLLAFKTEFLHRVDCVRPGQTSEKAEIIDNFEQAECIRPLPIRIVEGDRRLAPLVG